MGHSWFVCRLYLQRNSTRYHNKNQFKPLEKEFYFNDFVGVINIHEQKETWHSKHTQVLKENSHLNTH